VSQSLKRPPNLLRGEQLPFFDDAHRATS